MPKFTKVQVFDPVGDFHVDCTKRAQSARTLTNVLQRMTKQNTGGEHSERENVQTDHKKQAFSVCRDKLVSPKDTAAFLMIKICFSLSGESQY
ncbi:hypothetical protein PROFUN_16720 [Planoprotostelium fungivorum]|uniref:Uncharacterized protein n=1 Tax=Planoprotostelium fungivorum TaxID=1890364 RepID=A0A2P6MPP4_9EUKA|nr:hypothetical protein PROFUN_16720 [Planoprotostelium fungivorum]